MTSPELIEGLQAAIAGRVTVDASLAPFTTFRVGGPADVLVEASSEADLAHVARLRGDASVTVVGKGSNLLVSDDGFRGIAIRLGRAFRTHEVIDDHLRLGGAVQLPAAARLTARLGLTGFEFAAEIPATFGGAVRMNAGAHGREMKDVLVSARIVDLRTGEASTISVDQLGYAYRRSSLGADDIVVSGDIRLEEGDGRVVAEQIATYLRWRREHQPGGRSAGSVFRNPDGDSAGRLIDTAGGKGLCVGGAAVSDVHANFIVADADATATDVWTLVRTIRDLVATRHGVALEPEVRFLGSFPDLASK